MTDKPEWNDEPAVIGRVAELLRPRVPWHRRLWALGTVMSLRELLEASVATANSILSEGSCEYFRSNLPRQVEPDRGLGPFRERQMIKARLKDKSFRPESLSYIGLQAALERIENTYLGSWANAIRTESELPSVERTSRCLASHLLDAGMSTEHATEQWYRLTVREGAGLADVLDQLQTELRQPMTAYEAVLAFQTAPLTRTTRAPKWQDGPTTKRWLERNGIDRRNLRFIGSLREEIRARDPWTAAAKARERFTRVLARASVADAKPLVPFSSIWLAGVERSFPLASGRHGVEVPSLSRADHIYQENNNRLLDNAIELIGTFDTAPAPHAITSGWAAVESMLIGPGDGDERVVAAQRMALLVACSFVRAELTTLASIHEEHGDDALATELRSLPLNRERNKAIAVALRESRPLRVKSAADRCAEARAGRLLSSPVDGLADVRWHAENALRRLYRQRNLIAHGGHLEGIAVAATARTVAPILGAGFDRIAHAALDRRISALRLVVNAEVGLGTLDPESVDQLVDLLE